MNDIQLLKQRIDEKANNRLWRLENTPSLVTGDYDAEHLKAIHGYLFQDSTDYIRAGQFREPVEQGWYHVKQRDMYPKGLEVFYANNPTEKVINEALSQAIIELQSSEDPHQFSKTLSELYARLDYQHPFEEGNSRTLRYFTSILAKEYGYQLDWSQTADSKLSRVELYIARDTKMISTNFDFSQENIDFLKIHDNTEYGKHKEYLDNKIMEFLEEATHEYQFRSLEQIIHDNLSPFELTQDQLKTIDLYKQQLISRINDPEKIEEIIKKIDEKIPDIAAGKIQLPDIPNQEVKKGLER